jgi:hemerythrin
MEIDLTLLTWSHECIVGVKAMDDQHGILMDTLNDLRLKLVQGAEHKDTCEQLDRLIEFTQQHFHCEEQLLEQQGFPGLAEHRAAHQLLLTQIQITLDRTRHNGNLELQPLLHFLRSWFLEHIEVLDQEYGPWLNARGVY